MKAVYIFITRERHHQCVYVDGDDDGYDNDHFVFFYEKCRVQCIFFKMWLVRGETNYY